MNFISQIKSNYIIISKGSGTSGPQLYEHELTCEALPDCEREPAPRVPAAATVRSEDWRHHCSRHPSTAAPPQTCQRAAAPAVATQQNTHHHYSFTLFNNSPKDQF